MIVGVQFNVPAVVYVDTDADAIHKQILVTEEMTPTGTYTNEAGERVDGLDVTMPVEAVEHAKRLAIDGAHADGVLVDWPGWDWS